MSLHVDSDENLLDSVVDHCRRQAPRIVRAQSDSDLRQQPMVRQRIPILSGSHHGVPSRSPSFRSGLVHAKVIICHARRLMPERHYRTCQSPLHPGDVTYSSNEEAHLLQSTVVEGDVIGGGKTHTRCSPGLFGRDVLYAVDRNGAWTHSDSASPALPPQDNRCRTCLQQLPSSPSEQREVSAVTGPSVAVPNTRSPWP
jgi:hypothetical protein